MRAEICVFMSAVLIGTPAHFVRAQTQQSANPYASQQAELARQQAAAEAARRAAAQANQASQNAAARGSQANNNSAGNTANQIGSQLLASGMSKLPSCCGAVPPTCCPIAIMEIIMGLMGLAQGGANKGAAANHGQNAAQNAASSNPYAMTSTDGAPGAGGDAAAFAAIAAAKKNGVKYNPKTGQFTLPNGTTMGPSSVSREGALGAGVSAAEFDKTMAKIAEMEKKAAAAEAKLASPEAGFEGGGGGGSTSYASTEEAAPSYGAGIPREPTSVAGMSRNFNGDMIGVAGDNIFTMMARRYRQMDSKDSFLPPDAQ